MTTYQTATSTTQTLVANTADTIELLAAWGAVRVTNLGTTVIWLRTDGTAATVAGAGCTPVLAGTTVYVLQYFDGKGASTANPISLISSSTPQYTVAGVNVTDSGILVASDMIPRSLLTTAGDMIYATAASTPARLALGAGSYILASSGSAPTWSSPTDIRGGYCLAIDRGATRNWAGVPTTTSVAWTANRAYYGRILVYGGAAVTSVSLNVNTSSGNIDVGVYSNSGGTASSAVPAAKQNTSGSTACPAAGSVTVAIASSAAALGDWLAFSADNATVAISGSSLRAFPANGETVYQTSAFPLPASASSLTNSVGGVVMQAA